MTSKVAVWGVEYGIQPNLIPVKIFVILGKSELCSSKISKTVLRPQLKLVRSTFELNALKSKTARSTEHKKLNDKMSTYSYRAMSR